MKHISFLNEDNEMFIIRDAVFVTNDREIVVQQDLQTRLNPKNKYSTQANCVWKATLLRHLRNFMSI